MSRIDKDDLVSMFCELAHECDLCYEITRYLDSVEDDYIELNKGESIQATPCFCFIDAIFFDGYHKI